MRPRGTLRQLFRTLDVDIMKPCLLACAFIFVVTAVQAEGPATGPSDQTGCANRPDQELKATSGSKEKPKKTDPPGVPSAKQDCPAKQERAEEPKPATAK